MLGNKESYLEKCNWFLLAVVGVGKRCRPQRRTRWPGGMQVLFKSFCPMVLRKQCHCCKGTTTAAKTTSRETNTAFVPEDPVVQNVHRRNLPQKSYL
jgi:hypothetical protein